MEGGGCCGPCCATFWLGCCSPFYTCGVRHRLRTAHNLPEAPCGDCCVHCFCQPCAVIQEATEIEAHTRTVVYATEAPAQQAMA
jgi:Cys-rich protein (TIGR01571 family)